MVWLLEDYYDVQHRAYMMSEKKQVIIIVVGILKYVSSSSTSSEHLICVFAVPSTSEDSISRGLWCCHALR